MGIYACIKLTARSKAASYKDLQDSIYNIAKAQNIHWGIRIMLLKYNRQVHL